VTAPSSPPATVAAPFTFSVTDTTQNAGVTGSAPATSTRYYLSTDALHDAGDFLLTGARAVPTLAAGASSAGTVTVTIPASVPVGPYFLLACGQNREDRKSTRPNPSHGSRTTAVLS